MRSLMGSIRVLGASALAAMMLASAVQAQPGAQPNMQSLHDALNLDASQEIAWRAFEAAMKKDDADQAARQRSAASLMPTLNAPRRADLALALLTADLETMRDRADALKAFYATLSPQQQGVLDKETSPQAQ